MIKDKYHIVYFIGIGGIGMSALALWFSEQGCQVFGYDRTSTKLTQKLESVGIPIHYEDSIDLIPELVLKEKEGSLVVFTPAIPKDHQEFNLLKDRGFQIKKRSEVLGEITKDVFTVAVAGTHGKTTTGTMIAHLLKYAGKNVTAFLGGISTNYNTNYIKGDLTGHHPVCIVEADEYDRSFLRLHPDYAIVTAMDADHLDIYGAKESLQKSFLDFVDLVPPEGKKLMNVALPEVPDGNTYGIGRGESRAENIRIANGAFVFDFKSDKNNISDILMNQPGFHNVENATAAIQVCLDLGVSPEKVKEGLERYKGVRRRFEYIIQSEKLVYVDDYAHHPVEIDAFLGSLRELYPARKLTAIFQPHLFSRTRDFLDGFAESLSRADSVFLLDIYPARENPLPGITSKLILEKLKSKEKRLATKETMVAQLNKDEIEVLATIGAGDIDTLVEPIKMKLQGI